MASSLRVNTIIPSSGTNVAIGTANGTITYNGTVLGISTFSQLTVGTGGTVITTTASGFVGIGTTNPGAKFAISGTTADQFAAILSNPNNRVRGDYQRGFGTAHPVAIIGNNDDTTDGEVGHLALCSGDLTPTTGQYCGVLEFMAPESGKTNGNASMKALILGGLEGSGGSTGGLGGNIQFWTKSDNTSNLAIERFRITAEGNIGIGLTNPSKLIEVGAANTTSKFQLSPHGAGWDLGASSGNVAPHYQTNLSLYTGQIGSGTLRWQINNSGQVVVPYQPSFRAGRSTNYNPGANTDIIFNTTANTFHHNTGGHYSTSNGRFTCPVAGRYFFTACIIWGGGLSNQSLIDAAYIFVNGSNACYSFRRAAFISGTTGGTDGYYTDHLNCILNLNVDDYVTIRNNYNIQVHGNETYCWFAGHLLG